MVKQTPIKPIIRKPAGSALRVITQRVFPAFLRTALSKVFSYTRVRTGLAVLVATLALAAVPVSLWLRTAPVYATPASTLNFQARLQMANGSVAADGDYNIRFKLYDSSDPADTTALWSETYQVSAGTGLETINGYMSTDLGSVTPFPSDINWGQQLYLTMEVGGITSTPAWDGEMDPRLPLTSVPAAFTATSLSSYDSTTGNTSSLKLAPSTSGDQTFTIGDQGAAGSYTLLTTQAANSMYVLSDTGTPQAASLYMSGAVKSTASLQAPSVDTTTATALNIGQTNATAINLDQDTTVADGSSLTVTGSTSLDGGLTVSSSDDSKITPQVVIQNTGTGDATLQMSAGGSTYYLGVNTNNNNAFSIGSAQAGAAVTTTAGKTTTTGSSVEQSGNYINATKITTGSLAIGTQSISLYFPSVTNNPTHAQVAIYSDNSGDPGTLLAHSTTQTITAGWNTLSISASLSPNTNYWISQQADGEVYQTIDYASGNNSHVLNTYGSWPTSSGGWTTGTGTLAMYLTYTTTATTLTDDYGASLFSLGSTGQATFHNAYDSVSALQVQNAAGTGLLTADTTDMLVKINGGLTVTNAGNVAFQKGTDFSTTGTSNDVNFGTGAVFRLTGASSQTITGIANGADGRILTLINAASQAAVLSNSSSSSAANSSAANRIVTGTGSDLTIAAGASVSLIYDSGASVWRIVGTISGTTSGGSYVTLQGSTPGTADSGNFNINGVGIATTLQGTTSVKTSLLDAATSGTLNIGTTTATAIALNQNTTIASGKTLTVNGSGFDASGQLGLGTTSPGRQLEIDVNNSTITAMPVLIKQSGAGDSGIEYKTANGNFFAGIDATDGAFKISSSAAAQSSTTTQGYATKGSSTDQNASVTQATKMVASANGTVQSISVWLGYVTAATPNVQVGLYADNGSGTAPGTLLTSSTAAAATANSLNTFSVNPVSITNGTTYWLALATQSADTYYGDSGGNTVYANSYPMASSFTTSSTSSAKLSIYATITTSGGMTDEFGTNAQFSLSNSGQLQLRNSTNSSTAFSVQNASGSSIFNVDTSTANVTVTGTQTITGNLSAGYASTIYNSNTGTDADGLLIKLGVANASRTTSNYFVGFATGDGTIAGKIQGSASAVAYTTSGADYAEYFRADPDDLPQAGELVTIDSSRPNGVRRAVTGDTITGVISTSPGFIGNGPICEQDDQDCDENYAKTNVLVSLNGQVPLKTNDEGGEIHVGDPIGASSVPGVATRATSGTIIGYALTTPDADGMIQVTVSPHNSDPTQDLQADSIVANSLNLSGSAFVSGNLNVSGDASLVNLIVSGNVTIGGALTVTGAVSVTDITVGGHLITAGNVPTIQINANAGTNASVTVTGNDTSGTITITTGDGTTQQPLSAGALATITFAKVYGAAPQVMLTGNDGTSANMAAYPANRTVNGFDFSLNQVPQAHTTYTFTYFTVQ